MRKLTTGDSKTGFVISDILVFISEDERINYFSSLVQKEKEIYMDKLFELRDKLSNSILEDEIKDEQKS